MPGAQQIGADVFAAPQQIAGRFFLLGRNVNRRQRPGPIQHRELRGIAPIRLDPIARPPRNQRRRDHVAGDALRVNARCNSKPQGPAS